MTGISEQIKTILSKVLSYSHEEFELWLEQVNLQYVNKLDKFKLLLDIISNIPSNRSFSMHIDVMLRRYPILEFPLYVTFKEKLESSQSSMSEDTVIFFHEILSSKRIDYKYEIGRLFNYIISEDIKGLNNFINSLDPDCLKNAGVIEFVSYVTGYFQISEVYRFLGPNVNPSYLREGLLSSNSDVSIADEVFSNPSATTQSNEFRKNFYGWQSLLNREAHQQNQIESVVNRIFHELKKLGLGNIVVIDYSSNENCYLQIGGLFSTLIKNKDEIYDLKKSGIIYDLPHDCLIEFLKGIHYGFQTSNRLDLFEDFKKIFEQIILDAFINEIKSKGASIYAEDLFERYNLVDYKFLHEFYIESIMNLGSEKFTKEVHVDHILQIYSENPISLANEVDRIVEIDLEFACVLRDYLIEDIEELQLEVSNMMEDESGAIKRKLAQIELLSDLYERFGSEIESKQKRQKPAKRSFEEITSESGQVLVTSSNAITFFNGINDLIQSEETNPPAKRTKFFEAGGDGIIEPQDIAINRLTFKVINLIGKIVEASYELFSPEIAWQLIERQNKYLTALQNFEITTEYFGVQPNNRDYAAAIRSSIPNLKSFVDDEVKFKELEDLFSFAVNFLER